MTTQLTCLPPIGSLDSYINYVYSVPLLTPEEEYDAACKVKANGDKNAAATLVMSHLRIVVSLARNFEGYGLPMEDLIQEGNIGLVKAVGSYDPSIGVRFFSYAVRWVKSAMFEFIVNNYRMVRIATTKAQKKLFFNLRSLKDEGTLTPSDINRISEELQVKPEEVMTMEQRFAGGDVSINVDSEDDDGPTYTDWLSDTTTDPVNVLETVNDENIVTNVLPAALSTLDDRSKTIVEARWMSDNPKTLHELAAQFDVSAERIRQIENNAIKKLKTIMTR